MDGDGVAVRLRHGDWCVVSPSHKNYLLHGVTGVWIVLFTRHGCVANVASLKAEWADRVHEACLDREMDLFETRVEIHHKVS